MNRYKKIVRQIILPLGFLLFSSLLHAQVVTGKVIDAKTGKPLPNASIYLNGTYAGTSSDTEGNFVLKITKTNIPLIVSYMGYESQMIANYSGQDLKVALKPRSNELKEVTIHVDDMSREKEMKIFMKEFIGSNNKDCTISNPDDIYFSYSEKNDLLVAHADRPLIILNKRLGYKITYFLSDFRYVPLQTSYQGNYFFADDTTGVKAEEIEKILKARDDAYFGSRMHFMRSLWANALSSNSFYIYKPVFERPRTNNYDIIKPNLISYDYIVMTENDQKFIMLKKEIAMNEICIIYQKGKKVIGTSFLRQDNDDVGIIIDSNGFYGEGILWKGDMGISRVNKLLPYEFQPGKLQ